MNYPKMIKDFGGFDALSAAEQDLVEKTCAGEPCVLGDGALPDGPSEARNIRASLIRYLALGGCEAHPTHEKGVNLQGGYVKGQLDLELCKKVPQIALAQCFVASKFNLINAELEGLILTGALLAEGIDADGASILGDVKLNGDFRANREVCLAGAKIGGQLSCTNGHFSCSDGTAFNAQHAVVEGAFFWRNTNVLCGEVDLIRAHFSVLTDTLDAWPASPNLKLNGLRYDSILKSNMDVKARLDWLSKNVREGDEFEPQPYQHLAKVYKEMGFRRARNEVLMAMENRLRRHQFMKMRSKSSGIIELLVILVYGFLGVAAKLVVGYGYAPARALLWAITIVGLTSLWAKAAWDEGSMIPDAPQVLVSSQWQKLAGPTWEGSRTPGIIWSEKTKAGQDYETFHPIAYAADLFIPLVDFGQEAAWAPSTNRGVWGWHLWWLRWFIEGFGWIVTAMGAAAITGVIRNE